MNPVASDVAVIIYSRGREDCLSRLLDDLRSFYLPALRSGDLSTCIWVYAQHYAGEFIERLTSRHADLIEANALVVAASTAAHSRIGDVAQAAIHWVHSRSEYKLAMLMDDDSVYLPHDVVDGNVAQAARTFIDAGHQAYSIKLGESYDLEYRPFVDVRGPIMPFKEKMLWVGRQVLEDAVDLPRFSELSLGEDAVISAVAWLADPDACFAVSGMATFRHLGFESLDESGARDVQGGYAELMQFQPSTSGTASGTKYDEALRRGVTPHHILPDIFVPEGHPHYEFNGIREEVIGDVRSRARSRTRLHPA